MSINSTKGASIVTGAAQGIGRAIAIRLAKDGYDVALNDVPGKEDLLRTLVDEIVLQGRKSIIVIADVTKDMVANAGISLTLGREFIDTCLEDFERVLKVNLVGVFLCYREAARQMIQQGTWGRIIGASSINGKRGSIRSTGYTASKFGVVGITQCLAAEMIKHGITVNAYAPGLIDTPMTQKLITLEVQNLSEEEKTKRVLQRASAATRPDISMGVPEDVASLVSYLASEESKFMTGQTLSVNGGGYSG